MAAMAKAACGKYGVRTFALDLTGFGRSSGVLGLVSSFQHLIDDVLCLAHHVRERFPAESHAMFLAGESMGGCVVLRLVRQVPDLFNGAILFAPMVRIADKQRPPAWQVPLFKGLSFIAPKWAVLPQPDDPIADCFRDPEVCELVRNDPLHYNGKPRLKTAYEMLTASEDLVAHLEEITTPFLVLHGEADAMTDIEYSRLLHERASSTDKTILTYPGAYHCLIVEPDGIGEQVATNVMEWILARVPQTSAE